MYAPDSLSPFILSLGKLTEKEKLALKPISSCFLSGLDHYEYAEEEENPAWKPQTKEHHVGMEFEFIFPKETEKYFFFYFYLFGLAEYCTVAQDCSVSTNKGCHAELRVLTTERNYARRLIQVDKFFKKMKASVNNSCGLHIHLDLRSRKQQDVIQKVKCSRDFFKAIWPKRPQTWRGPDGDKCTMEIRYHEATVDVKKVMLWISLWVHIARSASIPKVKIKNLKECTDAFSLTKAQVAYLTDMGAAKINLPEDVYQGGGSEDGYDDDDDVF